VEYTDYEQEYFNALRAINLTFGSQYSLMTLWNYTQLDSMLADKDVLLVPEQEYASPQDMQAIVLAWSNTLSRFAQNGGVIIVCDYSGGTYRIFSDSGLLSITGVKNQTGAILFVNDPGDPLSKRVSPSFVAPNDTVCFNFHEARSFVSNGTSPVVIHRKLGQGHIVLLGFDFYLSNKDTEQILGNAFQLATPPDLIGENHGSSLFLIR
jgi:hypothetical protein